MAGEPLGEFVGLIGREKLMESLLRALLGSSAVLIAGTRGCLGFGVVFASIPGPGPSSLLDHALSVVVTASAAAAPRKPDVLSILQVFGAVIRSLVVAKALEERRHQEVQLQKHD